MSKNTNQNQNPVKKVEPQIANDPKQTELILNILYIKGSINKRIIARKERWSKQRLFQTYQNDIQQSQIQEKNQTSSQQYAQQKGQDQAKQQNPAANKMQDVTKNQPTSQQQVTQNVAVVSKQEDQVKAQQKLEKKQKKQEYLKQQKEYFDDLYREMQSDYLDDLVEGKQVIEKIDNENINKIECGFQQLQGLLFRKGNMIEEDQVEAQLLEAYKERESLQSQLLFTSQLIKDLESQIIEIPKTIQVTKKLSIVEETLIEKRLVDYKKQKEELEKKVKVVEKNIKNLQSQKIDNPRSSIGHAGLKAYLEQQEGSKIRDASIFVKKIQEEKKIFEEKMKKIESEQQAKHLQEEQDRIAKEARLKILKEKEKEEDLKKRIKEIQLDKIERLKQLQQHEDKYKLKKEKMNSGQLPLYMRLSKKFQSQQKLEDLEKQKNLEQQKESHKRIDEMNLFDHQQKYLDKLKLQEEERVLDKKKRNAQMREHIQKVSAFPVSAMWSQNNEESMHNIALDQKQRALKIVEARNYFADELKKKKKVYIDFEKRLEMKIKIDKLNNPSKYVKPLKRRNSHDSKNENSEEYDKFDEKRGKHNHVDKGLEYLEEVREAAKQIPKKARSEQPQSRQNRMADNMTDIKYGSVMSNFTINTSQMRTKIDYMSEIRSKYSLDKKSNEVKEWQRATRNMSDIDPYEKKKNLIRISKKLDHEARHLELMQSIQRRNTQSDIFTVEDVQNRQKIDEMYIESIKAKLAIFEQYNKQNQINETQSEQTQPEQQKQQKKQVKQNISQKQLNQNKPIYTQSPNQSYIEYTDTSKMNQSQNNTQNINDFQLQQFKQPGINQSQTINLTQDANQYQKVNQNQLGYSQFANNQSNA